MKILHLITRLIQGGAQENTVYTAAGQAALGHEVTLAYGPELNGESPFLNRPQDLEEISIPSLVRRLSPINDLTAYFQLKAIFQQGRYDIVHTHSSKAGILGRLAAADANRTAQKKALIVHTIHGLAFDEFQSPWRNRIYIAAEKMAAKKSQAIISVCDSMSEQALKAGIGTPALYHTVYSGSDLKAFEEAASEESRAAARKRLGIGHGTILLSAVTRLFPKKGADDILKALAESPGNFVLHLIGDGPQRKELEAFAAKHLPGRVIFHGQAAPQEIPQLICGSDLLVHASYREGLARVLVQALSANIPVVSTRAGGAHEIVLDGQNGFLVPIGDTRALAAVLGRILANPELLSSLKAGVAATDVSRFSIDAMVRETMAVYDLTGKKAAPC